MGAPNWDDASTEKLTKLWDAGLSGSRIAARMGMTRNAVLGKLHRLGLMAVSNTPRIPTDRLPMPKTFHSKPLPKLVIPDNAPASLGLSMMALSDRTCRYPYGDRDYTFCGHQTWPNSPYCGGHHRACRTTPAPLRRAV